MEPESNLTRRQKFFHHFFIALGLFLIATVTNYFIIAMYHKTINVSGIYLLAVILTSLLTGSYFWGMLSALGGVVGTNFCFTYPYFAIDFSLSGYPLTFFIMALVAIGTCALTVNIRKQRDAAHRREKMANILNEMDQRLLQIDEKKQIVALLLEYLHIQLALPVLYFEIKGEKICCIGHLGDAPGRTDK